MSVPFAVFGPGILILTRTDLPIVVPINVGYVQEFSLEAAGTTKQLYGQNQYPLAAARGTIKATGKIKAAVLSGIAWNNAFYGQPSMATGGISWNVGSTFTSSTTSSTVLVGSSLTFDADLGVTYVVGGLPLQRVSTGLEATGKYSISSSTASGFPNLYNFAGTDGGTGAAAGGTALKITYSQTAVGGQTLAVTNQPIGTTPTFQIDYYTNLNQPTSKPLVVRVFQAIGAKHAMQFKLEDFAMPEFDFDLFADNSNRVYNFYFPEVA